MAIRNASAIIIFVSAAILPQLSPASTGGSDKVQVYLDQTLQQLNTEKSWKKFVDEHPALFPKVNKTEPTYIKVERVPEKIDGESYTLGAGYRQTFIKASMDRVIQ